MEKSLKEFEEFIERNAWRDAKTLRNPHQYIVKGNLNHFEKKLFVDFVKFIRENGYPIVFWKKDYTCFDIKGLRYWTMGDIIENTIILNRCKNE